MLLIPAAEPPTLLYTKSHQYMYVVGMRIEIPENLADRVKPVVSRYGYSSTTDFIRESVRLRLEELEEQTEEDD